MAWVYWAVGEVPPERTTLMEKAGLPTELTQKKAASILVS